MNKGEGASAGHNMNSGWLLIRTMVNIDANANNGNTQVCADLKKIFVKSSNCNFVGTQLQHVSYK